jgi:hypothetical protein
MNEESSCSELAAADAALLDLGVVLGQNQAFSLVAGRCTAAAADGLRRLREQKLYKRCTEKWGDFCSKYLKMSRVEADRIIKLLAEFGPTYFELSQLTRVSPETYRAIAPHIEDGVLRHNGEAIELNAENSRKVAAAVGEVRSSIPKKTSEVKDIAGQLKELCHGMNVEERIGKLAECCFTIAFEFEKLARDERLGRTRTRIYLEDTLARVRDEMVRVAHQRGL